MESPASSSPAPPVPPLGRAAGVAVRWNGAAALVTLVSQLAQIFVLARWLSPAEFGLAAAALAVITFVAGLSGLGLTNALIHRDVLTRKAWASAWWASLVAGLVLLAGSLATATLLENLLRLPGLAALIVFAAVVIPVSGPSSVYQAHLQRHLRFRRLATVEIVAALLGLVVALVWAWFRREALALVAGQVVHALVRGLALAFASPLRPAPRLRWAELRPVAGYSGYQLAERVAAHALTSFDRLLVARFLGPAAAGYYFMASQIAFKPVALLGPFTARTLLPLLARIRAERARTASSYLRALSSLSLPSAIIYMLLFGLAAPLVAWVLGPGWEPSVPVLQILCLAGFLMVPGNVLGNLTMALGRAGVSFWTGALLLAARLVAIPVGARYGLEGVAAALLVVTLLSLTVDYVLPRLWLGVGAGALTRAAGWAVPPAVAGGGVMLGVVAWLGGASTFVELGVAGTAGLATFLLCARLLAGDALKSAVFELVDKLGKGAKTGPETRAPSHVP
ncbi:MAG TPA: lipopolysaccharide biosynthesis protein [Fibrobacteria bacterium]|nr:lipopolysaccharide biosynthesis protein [Fibrobacteria bacterium]